MGKQMTEIPQANEDRDNYPCWVNTYAYNTTEQMRPYIICKCGVECGIGNHRVHVDGTITASFYHNLPAGDSCGWHVHLKMIGWDGGEFKPQQ